MNLAFLGTGDFGVPAFRALAANDHRVLIAISQPDRPAGRGRSILPTAIRAVADELQVHHVQTEDINALNASELFQDCELAIVAAFGQKIGPRALHSVPGGFINLHASLLPRYRGAAPFQHAVLSGDTETGVTVFQLNERWDAGAIWSQAATTIGETETATQLHDRLALIGADLLLSTLDDWRAGRIVPKQQDAGLASRAPKLSPADRAIDWTRSARLVARRINGLWSWPAATATFESAGGKCERVQLCRARAESIEAAADVPPGGLRADGRVQCGDGAVEIMEIKPAGGNVMPFSAFSRGRDVRPPARMLPAEATG